MSSVYFGDWITIICHFSLPEPILANNSEQHLRSKSVPWSIIKPFLKMSNFQCFFNHLILTLNPNGPEAFRFSMLKLLPNAHIPEYGIVNNQLTDNFGLFEYLTSMVIRRKLYYTFYTLGWHKIKCPKVPILPWRKM